MSFSIRQCPPNGNNGISVIARFYYLDHVDWGRCLLSAERHVSSLDQQCKMETLLSKVMCQGLLDLLFNMVLAQPAVWVTWSVQHLDLQGYLLPSSTHEAMEVTTAAQTTIFGHRTWSKAAEEVTASQKNVPSRTFSTLSHAKQGQVDSHLVGVHRGCWQTKAQHKQISFLPGLEHSRHYLEFVFPSY